MNYNKILDKKKYQVFFFRGKLYFPLNIAYHSWIILNNKGNITRWEVLSFRHKKDKKFGYLHKDFLPPTKWFYSDLEEGKLMKFYESKSKNSVAFQVINFINKNIKNYPYQKKYLYYPGPNSNTFTQ